MTIENIKTPEDILEYMKENIKYGFIDNNQNIYPDNDKDWDNSFSEHYQLQISSNLLKTKYGVCWDQVELERYLLKKINIKSKSYFIVEYDGKQYPTHTFIVINDNNKYYWFEHSWEPHRGIYEFNSLNELLLDVNDKFKKMLINKKISTDDIIIYEYEEPTKSLNCLEFYQHCEQGKIVSYNDYIFSNNFDDIIDIFNSLDDVEKKYLCNGTFKNSPYVVYRNCILNGKIRVGFIEIYELPNEKYEFITIAVKKEFRKKNVATILLDKMFKEFKSKYPFMWRVDKNNNPSNILAQKYNFKLIESEESSKNEYILDNN